VPTRKLWLAIALPLVVVLAVLIWLYPTNSDFKVENPSWNGGQDFGNNFRALPLNSIDALPAEPKGTTLIIIPYLKFDTADLERIEEYVTSGGRLVLLDDYGFGNELLQHFGVEARFTHGQLLDPLFNYKNKNLPMIIDFVQSPATNGVQRMVFNHATSLENIPQNQVVAWSSHFSFLDENQNGAWDEGEPKGPLPVAAKLDAEEGEIVLVADPSILITSMLEMGDNQQFLENVVQGEVLLDQAHLPEVALDEAKDNLKVTRNALSTIGGTLALVVLVLTLTLQPIWRNKGGQR